MITIKSLIEYVKKEAKESWREYLCWMGVGGIIGFVGDNLWVITLGIILMNVIIQRFVYLRVKKERDKFEKSKLNTQWGCPSN